MSNEQNNRRRNFILTAVAAAAGVVVADCCLNIAPASDTSKIKPEFTGMTIEDKPFNLAQTEGKVVLVTFWATWCPTCRAEMPELRKVHAARLAKGMEWINISIDEKKEDLLKWREVLTTTGTMLKSPVIWINNEGTTHNFGRVRSTPTHVLINRKGMQAERWKGTFNDKHLAMLDSLLAQPA